jgi:site-specific recombinase XerD
MGLRDAVDGFLFSLRAEGRTSRTIEYYDDLLGCFLRYAKSNKWPDNIQFVDARQLRQFLSWVGSRTFEHDAGNGSRLARKAKSSTAWPYYKALRRLFNWLVEEGLVESSPVTTIHFKTPPPPPIQPFTVEELRRLMAVCDLDIRTGARFTGLRNKAMVLLFVDSALRRKEMVDLRITDLDLENRHVRVLGKGNKVGIVPFSPKAAKAIWIYLMERKSRAKSDRLFLTEEGTPFSINGINSWFVRLKKRAGVNGPGGVHRLRHTAALAYLRGARDSFLLQLFLRHEDLTMSRRYTQGLKAEEAIEAHRRGASPVEGLGLG